MDQERIKAEALELLSITFISPEVQAFARLARHADPPRVRFAEFLPRLKSHARGHFGQAPPHAFLGLAGVDPVQTIFDRAVVELAETLIFFPEDPETLARAVTNYYEFILARCARLHPRQRRHSSFDSLMI